MSNTQTTPQNSTVFQAEVLAISEVAKNLLLGRNAQSKYCRAG